VCTTANRITGALIYSLSPPRLRDFFLQSQADFSEIIFFGIRDFPPRALQLNQGAPRALGLRVLSFLPVVIGRISTASLITSAEYVFPRGPLSRIIHGGWAGPRGAVGGNVIVGGVGGAGNRV
jgi:hypothetical protein